MENKLGMENARSKQWNLAKCKFLILFVLYIEGVERNLRQR